MAENNDVADPLIGGADGAGGVQLGAVLANGKQKRHS